VACFAVLAGCGSVETTKQARIAAALRSLEGELHAPRLKLPPHADAAGAVQLTYTRPPKGVSRAEWEAAVRNDKSLPAALRASVSGGEGITTIPQEKAARTTTK
jgi:hypothetical protein